MHPSLSCSRRYEELAAFVLSGKMTVAGHEFVAEDILVSTDFVGDKFELVLDRFRAAMNFIIGKAREVVDRRVERIKHTADRAVELIEASIEVKLSI